jgi:histidine ammonia-lyase
VTEIVRIASAADLGTDEVVRIARANVTPALDDGLVDRLADRNARMLDVLAGDAPVYGVNTGMGAMSEHRLSPADQAKHQEALMLARAVGGAPWLRPDEARAALAVRLRTLLNDESGVRPALCQQLAALLGANVLPAIPRTGMGVAGEIIALAHLSAPLSGGGEVLATGDTTAPAGPALADAGLTALRLGPKEGVALIEGVPVTTALAILCAHDGRVVLRQATYLLAAQFAVTGASADALHPALARADDVLADLSGEVRALAGGGHSPRALQPPVSFRVSPQVLAHLSRALTALDGAIERALDGVTDSPAFLTDDTGTDRFVGTAGFGGYDLAGHLHFATAALVTAADVGSARLHRLMNPGITGLTAQLSPQPGPHAGLSPVHKRAAGVVHNLRRLALPAAVGPVETSLGQEDVQSFSLEAAEACRAAITGVTDVLACELLAVHQARCLGARFPDDVAADLVTALDRATADLPADPRDRPFGLDLTGLRNTLAAGWPGRPTS